MENIDLVPNLLKEFPLKPGKIGRYSISELWGCLNISRTGKPYKTPEQYLKGEEFDFESAMRMFKGIWKHKMVQNLMKDEWVIEKKKEYKHNDWVIVGMADGIEKKRDLPIEIKTSDKLITQAKSWHVFQLKMYLSMFKKEMGVVVQPVTTKTGFYLKVVGEVKRDDKWFGKQLDLVEEFHQKLLKI
tara:strand:- start:363 stop:923 length:561 start_codon:yes stop_codon:yes gene_type:complete